LGFKHSTSDSCLYSKIKSKAHVAVYVDDLLIADENDYEIEKTAYGLEKEFDLTGLGELISASISRGIQMESSTWIKRNTSRKPLTDLD
jgi:hypothetical protein